jgi:hypothetical protein
MPAPAIGVLLWIIVAIWRFIKVASWVSWLVGGLVSFFSSPWFVGAATALAVWWWGPTVVLDAGFLLLNKLVGVVGSLMPPPYGDLFMKFGDQLSAAPLKNAFMYFTYLASPIVQPHVTLWAIGVRVNTWMVTLGVRLAIEVKAWSKGAPR